jgi:hypothetical protein
MTFKIGDEVVIIYPDSQHGDKWNGQIGILECIVEQVYSGTCEMHKGSRLPLWRIRFKVRPGSDNPTLNWQECDFELINPFPDNVEFGARVSYWRELLDG